MIQHFFSQSLLLFLGIVFGLPIIKVQAFFSYKIFPQQKLIKKNLIDSAYGDIQEIIWDTMCKISSKWESWFNLVRGKISSKYQFAYVDIMKILGTEDHAETRQFLAYLNHVGCLKCENPFSEYEKRKYELPVLFRKV